MRWLVVAVAAVGCGRNPLALPARDAAISRPAPDGSADGRAGADGRDADAVPDARREDAAPDTRTPAADACLPLRCADPTCFPAYCGTVGDGCGGNLYCGLCAAGWSCRNGQCFPDVCQPVTCDNATPFPYCGRIGDGCGGTLDCACPTYAPTCLGHVCNGVGAGCVPIAGCVNSWGDEYCGGPIGDGCGGVLDCGGACSRSGFVCRDQRCVDPRDAEAPSGAVPPPLVPPPPPPLPPPPPPPPCPPPPPPLPPNLW